MSNRNTYLLLGGGALALWWLSRRKVAGTSTAPGDERPWLTGPYQGETPEEFAKRAHTPLPMPDVGTPVDVAPALGDMDFDPLVDGSGVGAGDPDLRVRDRTNEQTENAGRDVAAADAELRARYQALIDRFYRLVWEPASRIPISALGKNDIADAIAFMGQKFDRVPGVQGNKLDTSYLAELKDTAEAAWAGQNIGQTIDSVFGLILSMYGVKGDVHSPTGGLIKDSAAATMDAVKKEVDAVKERYQHFADFHNFVERYLRPGAHPLSYGSFAIWDPTRPETYDTIKTTSDGTRFRVREALFASYQGYRLLPWNSVQLHVDGIVSLRMTKERCNAVARMYRTLDFLGSMFFQTGDKYLDADAWNEFGQFLIRQPEAQYQYRTKYGVIAGSCFPPQGEDQKIDVVRHIDPLLITDVTHVQNVIKNTEVVSQATVDAVHAADPANTTLALTITTIPSEPAPAPTQTVATYSTQEDMLFMNLRF